MLTSYNRLDSQQLNALDALLEQCKAMDGNTIPIYSHILGHERGMNCNILYVIQQQLVGFLSPYFFFEDKYELSMMVHPLYRRRGIAKQMLNHLMCLIDLKKINALMFSTPHAVNDTWLQDKNFVFQNSEFEMQRVLKNQALPAFPLDIRQATLEDIPFLSQLDMHCFPEHTSDMEKRFQMLLLDPNYMIMIACVNDTPIGKAHIQLQAHSAKFSDIAILPDLQRRGFGQSLLAYCINQVLQLGKIKLYLDVETRNLVALELYKNLDFTITNAWDYWTLFKI